MPECRSPEDGITPLDHSKSIEHGFPRDENGNQPETPDHTHVEEDGDSDTISTNSSDEFDWDEEEVTSQAENPETGKKARRGRALWLGFMKLARPVRTLLVGVLGAAFFITPLLVVELRFKDKESVRPLAQHTCLWMPVPRIAIYVIFLFGGQVERLKTQIELTLAVSAWLKLVLDISWAWIALSAITTFYKPPGSYWVVINRVMQALFTAGIILLVEKLFLRFVAINFHQRALADRLAENRMGLKALDHLSNAQPAPVKKSPHAKKGHKHALSFFRDCIRPPASRPVHLLRLSKRRASTKYIISRTKSAIPVALRQKDDARVALKNSKLHRGGDFYALDSARKLAKKLFDALSVTSPGRSHLVVEDFYPFFRSTAEAHAAFAIFDKDGNGDITKREMREAVQRIYRERKALTASLKDVGSAVAKLDAVLVCIALLGILFACLLIFNRSDTLASLVPLATIILGFSFIFGHSAQTLFESMIFIFSTHVFDVGDLVMIDDQYLIVKEFGLFSTTFRRVDGQEIIAPNSLLSSTKLVHNLRRSNSMWESTTLMIAYNTPLELVEQLKARIQAYITANNREWSGSAVNIDKMEFQNAIHLTVAVEHRPNWQDWGGRWTRRTAFMKHLKSILEDLDVKYTMPMQPVLLPDSPRPTSGFRSVGVEVNTRGGEENLTAWR
ncbi:Mechanosensitive ion channel-domain-containing protein [Suillus paluster]|uniref:Mechanosensitive ion channel-domain-containing protein n=1 Tax=Suillus paluster TaxID=48578 RepID=UPI001B868BEA|nr:Mechanosensitive ion channel-domain-containing protein [Suillus paluster]KAG1752650.1 Mechanosensitive ion channel-domain-containing protein [Suillus paluster]